MKYSSDGSLLSLWSFKPSLNLTFILQTMSWQCFKVLSYYILALETDIFCMFVPKQGKQTYLAFWIEVSLFSIISVKSSSIALCPSYHSSQPCAVHIINLDIVPVSKLIQPPSPPPPQKKRTLRSIACSASWRIALTLKGEFKPFQGAKRAISL